jgi:hypothetical protein
VIRRLFAFLFWRKELYKQGTQVQCLLGKPRYDSWEKWGVRDEYYTRHPYIIYKLTNEVTGSVKFKREYL